MLADFCPQTIEQGIVKTEKLVSLLDIVMVDFHCEFDRI